VFSVDALANERDERLALVASIDHDSPVRRSGYIGDKLYSIANDSVKVVDVANPGTVLNEVTIETVVEIPPLQVAEKTFVLSDGLVLTPVLPPALIDPTAKPIAPITRAIDRARRHLANELGREEGAPMFVSAEAVPDAPGGGYLVVFRLGDRHRLYRASESGLVEAIDGDFAFEAGSDAWHSIDWSAPYRPMVQPGDFNRDDIVDEGDYAAWKQAYGKISLATFQPADGNLDGVVDSSDYTVWRNNLGRIAGDFDRNGSVDDRDRAFWKANFGATSGPGLAADGNHDGKVDSADFTFWANSVQRQLAREAARSATSGVAAFELTSAAGAGSENAEQLPSSGPSMSNLVSDAGFAAWSEPSRTAWRATPSRYRSIGAVSSLDDRSLLLTLNRARNATRPDSERVASMAVDLAMATPELSDTSVADDLAIGAEKCRPAAGIL
jgi:hypothetical protein